MTPTTSEPTANPTAYPTTSLPTSSPTVSPTLSPTESFYCYVVGGSHHQTFDGHWFDHMGQCSNVLLKDCSTSPIGGGRRFEVQIIHADRPSLPAEQITNVIGTAIQLPAGDVLELGTPEAGRTNSLNGAALPALPYTSPSGDVSIEVSSDLHPRYLVTVRSLGAKVFWDGVDTARVVLDGISPLRGGCLTGLCGNWDENVADDIDRVDERDHWKTDFLSARRSRRAAIGDQRDPATIGYDVYERGDGLRVQRQAIFPSSGFPPINGDGSGSGSGSGGSGAEMPGPQTPTTSAPSPRPTEAPHSSPTGAPATSVPTATPTPGPTGAPTTSAPSATPTPAPSAGPTALPSAAPTSAPTDAPVTSVPSATPTSSPTRLTVTSLFTNDSTTCAESLDSPHTRLCTGSARRAARDFCADFFTPDVYEPCWAKVDPQPQYDNCIFDHCNSGPALACASYRLYEALCDVRGIRHSEFTNAVVEAFTGSCYATAPPTAMPTSSEPTAAPTAEPTTANPTSAPTTSDPTASPTTSPTLAAEIGFTCYASGDPHYLTFDGLRYAWHGQCSYLLTGETTRVTGFEVHVRNSPRSTSQVTYTTAVTVRLPGSGDLVELARTHAGRLNGAAMPALPYMDADGNRIERHSGGKVAITAPLVGATVEFYSTGAVRVRAIGNSTLRGNAEGLCGDFAGNASTDANHIGMHGHWRVGGGQVNPMSTDPTAITTGACVESNVTGGTRTCTPAGRIAAAAFCQRLLDATYAACHAAVDPMPFFNECVFDHCEDVEQACSSFQIYEDMCADEDVDVSNASIVSSTGACTNPTPVFTQEMCPTSAPTPFPSTAGPTTAPSLAPTTSEPTPMPTPMPTTSESTTSEPTPVPTASLTGCAVALCGRDCALLAPGCGWSKNSDGCIAGGRTTGSEMTLGTCTVSGGNSAAPTPPPTDGCARFTCGQDCATDPLCGWSTKHNACVAGGRTTDSEMTIGVCTTSPPVTSPPAAPSGPNCGVFTCGLDCSLVAGCGWDSGTNSCVAGARTNPLEMTSGPGCQL